MQLLESWLRATPDLQFRDVRIDARKLNITVTARQFAEARRRVGVTAAPPRSAARPSGKASAGSMQRSDTVSERTPLMTFVIEFLRQRPDASYGDVKTAADAAGFSIAPINFGNARRALGMNAKPRTTARPRRPQPAAEPAPSQPAPPVARRGRRKGLDLSNLSSMVAELQDVLAERDRYMQALDQIAGILKNVL